MIRVLLVDDQALVRTGFRVILDAQPDIEVIGEAGDGRTGSELAVQLAPDVVCMDVQMPEVDGLEATRRIIAGSEPPAVLVLTTFDRDDYLFQALDAGASGFLLKTASPEQLVDAVRVLARGDALLAPAVTRRVIARYGSADGASDDEGARGDADPRLGDLTEREAEVYRLLADGLSNAEIAAELYVGEATVKTHVSSILLKLGVRDRVQAVVRAYRTGFISAH
ncbi:response regulator transcription factor [Homoserinibacter sp. GY 40078]|uniref:response regulator n=1 Tax=Homoserinibacter sp. GY 40078 TaxID=2603275 RepID=UPI0011CCBEC7|nr:response regulator transcription factor [Homoserinibacter sp. GY 40078]TXK19003.1 response regulator transcription factor [Homoserinibacter sp. GY 40078]